MKSAGTRSTLAKPYIWSIDLFNKSNNYLTLSLGNFPDCFENIEVTQQTLLSRRCNTVKFDRMGRRWIDSIWLDEASSSMSSGVVSNPSRLISILCDTLSILRWGQELTPVILQRNIKVILQTKYYNVRVYFATLVISRWTTTVIHTLSSGYEKHQDFWVVRMASDWLCLRSSDRSRTNSL